MSIRGCTDDHHLWKNGVPKGGPMSYIHAAIQIRASSLINARHMMTPAHVHAHTHTEAQTWLSSNTFVARKHADTYVYIYIV